MKLIRLTDDRYVFDAGPGITQDDLYQIGQYFEHWWQTHNDRPTVVVLGGSTYGLEYEDRRDADIEGRLATIEEKVAQLIEERRARQ